MGVQHGVRLGLLRKYEEQQELARTAVRSVLWFFNGDDAAAGGLKLINQEDDATVKRGWYWVTVGCIVMATWPPILLGATHFYAKLSDRKLTVAITAIFKSLPSLLGSILYISVFSLRCILDASPSKPIIEQCGNPAMNTGYVTNFCSGAGF